MGRHVALLRGINVGGKHKLPMKTLVSLFEESGCSDVRTYIQSGNVVFSATAAIARRIPTTVAQAIEDRFGFAVPVVIRTAEELETIVRTNPLLRRGVDIDRLHVAFLAAKPPAPAVAGLDIHRSPPDVFQIHGREIYLHCPNGMARTKFTNAYFDGKLGLVSTIRNWNTVRTLATLANS